MRVQVVPSTAARNWSAVVGLQPPELAWFWAAVEPTTLAMKASTALEVVLGLGSGLGLWSGLGG